MVPVIMSEDTVEYKHQLFEKSRTESNLREQRVAVTLVSEDNRECQDFRRFKRVVFVFPDSQDASLLQTASVRHNILTLINGLQRNPSIEIKKYPRQARSY